MPYPCRFTPLLLIILLTCFIDNLAGYNDPILSQVIYERLNCYPSSSTPSQKAKYLGQEIDAIGREALKRGMDLSDYAPQTLRNGALSFEAYPVWEGKGQKIPLTFFVYAWPPESFSLAKNPTHSGYCSNIHRHPISCAFTVLQGTLVQENYADVPGYTYKVAQKISSEYLSKGSKSLADEKDSIHRLVCQSLDGQNCLSLHAYGLPTAKEVFQCFKKTFDECCYSHIINKTPDLN